jgi:hypothetical protein
VAQLRLAHGDDVIDSSPVTTSFDQRTLTLDQNSSRSESDAHASPSTIKTSTFREITSAEVN